MLSIKGISFNIGSQDLFKESSFKLAKGERVGLVGPNGSGKSTLLRLIVGEFSPEGGNIERQGLTIAYLPQEIPEGSLNLTGIDYLGLNYSQTLASELGIETILLEQTLSSMSGGEKSKIAFLALSSKKYDVYLLDEPTNNLDRESIEALERFILASKATFIVVSHDRKFLDKTVRKILEINPHTKKLAMYSGSYTEYADRKLRELEREEEEYRDHVEKVEGFKESIKDKKAWAEKGHSSPNTTDNDRLLAGVMSDRSTHIFSIAKNLERRLRRMQDAEPAKPLPKRKLSFQFLPIERSGSMVFDARNIVKKLGALTLGEYNFRVEYGDKIAILGKNGEGKTTLLEILVGKKKPDRGVLTIGANLVVGYLGQNPLGNEVDTVLSSMLHATIDDMTEARYILSLFSLKDEDINKRIRDLSPGERSRLILARLVAQKPNCVVLDEPSNHLDLEALEALEKALRSFAGTVIVVSHDRYFLEQIKPEKMYELTRSSIKLVTS